MTSGTVGLQFPMRAWVAFHAIVAQFSMWACWATVFLLLEGLLASDSQLWQAALRLVLVPLLRAAGGQEAPLLNRAPHDGVCGNPRRRGLRARGDLQETTTFSFLMMTRL